MIENTRRPFWSVVRLAFMNAYHLVISAGIASIAWLVAYTYNREPDIIEAGWVFFCTMGILFHTENLTEAYSDKRAVERHPSSTDADLRNIGDHIRGEWLRIMTKSLFLISGFIALYFLGRPDPFSDVLRLISSSCLMAGVCILDLDAVLDKIARRHLIALILQEIDTRPQGLSVEERLRRGIMTGRDLFHDMNNELALIVPVLEALQATGRLPDGIDVAEILGSLEAMGSEIRAAHAVLRSYDPTAGGPSREKPSTEG